MADVQVMKHKGGDVPVNGRGHYWWQRPMYACFSLGLDRGDYPEPKGSDHGAEGTGERVILGLGKIHSAQLEVESRAGKNSALQVF